MEYTRPQFNTSHQIRYPIANGGAKLRIGHLVVRSDKPGPLFVFEGNNELTIDSLDLSGVAPGSVMSQHNGPGNTVNVPEGTRRKF